MVGFAVGRGVGSDVEGCGLGIQDGEDDDGFPEGDLVGSSGEGLVVGSVEDGVCVGSEDGCEIVGDWVGRFVGVSDVGESDGRFEG